MRSFLRIVLTALFQILLVGTAYADTTTGDVLYAGKDYAGAYRMWLPLAQQGDPAAQFGIAKMLMSGEGVATNYPLAVQWLRKAAEQGYHPAEAALGMAYEIGTGVETNAAESFKWYLRAAKVSGVLRPQR